MLGDMGKYFILIGLALVVFGSVLATAEKIPFLGKLPGDIFIKREGLTIYIPLTSMLIISGILTLVFRLFNE